ncbi:MAG: phosphoribosylformylglycinamidine synthase I [Candidatus Omnitrophica bacterium]|nr:phosphoribosylformylglycinamidine synthase I [Candidatus Omnitrophota bacterium]
MKPNVLIVRTAGTNCDKETEFAFNSAGARTSLRHINYIKEKNDFSDYQIIAIPGGFSYGDDLGAGKIMSLEFIYWLKESLSKFIEKGGLMIGICNGFQIMVKTGILPDLDFKQKVTLTDNDSGRFEDRWVYLSTKERTGEKKVKSIWLKDMPQLISLPVAHGEGKFYANNSILDKIEANGQAVLRYVDRESKLAGYPLNPNGSLNNIAGICDISGRVLGLMPHPERCIFKHHSPLWQGQKSEGYGLRFFINAVGFFK